ncbi:MAG: mycofactocin biosynthesis peptidyl-dipeptidase MftE, partial [Mycobacterium sp.]
MNSSYHRRVGVLGELGGSTSSRLQSMSLAVMIPLGSTEQHGPHLPLDTDTRIAAAVARGATARLADAPGSGDRRLHWLVAPAIGYGDSGEHQSFPGTISIGTEALSKLLVEYGRSASCWAQRLLFVNGHGGNVTALTRAVGQLRSEGRDVGWCACVASGADAHAGHTETSVLLHISPADVLTDQ